MSRGRVQPQTPPGLRAYCKDGWPVVYPGKGFVAGQAVVGVLLAGFNDVWPGTDPAHELVGKLAGLLDGSTGVVVHRRGCPLNLARWVADELERCTSITHTSVVAVTRQNGRWAG